MRERSLFVGFRSQKGLIDAVGCEQTTFYNWLRSDTPPERMQKGFDIALARALRTDRQTLFTGWREKNPSLAPLIDVDADDAKFAEDRRKRDAIMRNIRVLQGESLDAVLDASRREVEKLSEIVFERVRTEEWGRKPPPAK